jgi:replicative DNA helicase
MIGCREYVKPYDKVTAVSAALRDLAKTTNIPVVAACQLRRPEHENDRPTLFDCKEAGSIENDASLLLAVYRPKAAPAIRERTRSLCSSNATAPRGR